MSKLRKFILTFSAIFAVIILIYALAFFNNGFTGKVSLKLNSNYKQGQPLNGILRIVLKEGELIPASSKIIFENNGKTYRYDLNKSVSDNLNSGKFYVEGKSLSGTGEGYGIQGEKTIYPKVNFTLEIFSKSNSSAPLNIINKSSKSNTSAPLNIINKSSKSNVTSEISKEIKSSNKSQEQVLNKIEVSNSSKKIVKKENAPNQKVKIKTNPKPITTGNVISGFFSKTFNLFLGITGQVSLEFKNEVKAEVSSNKEFTYNLNKGQTAKILSGSVKTNSKKLSDDKVNLNIKGNQVIVTTTYSEIEKGFGQDYLNNNTKKILSINLSKLDFVPKQGDLKISLIYGNEEIVSLKTLLVNGKSLVENKTKINLTNTTSANIAENNISTINITESNMTFSVVSNNLTKKERGILIKEFGNVSVKITKAEKTSQRTIVRFELNNFWVEHSYNSGISDEKLKKEVGEDRIRFLKDLARKFSQQEIQKQEVNGLIGNYSI